MLKLEKICKILLQMNGSYFSKMVLHNAGNKNRPHYEPENLHDNKFCYAK